MFRKCVLGVGVLVFAAGDSVGNEPAAATIDGAAAALRRGDAESAVEIAGQLLKDNADFASARSIRIEALQRLGRFEDALGDCEHLVKQLPNEASSWNLRGSVRFKRGDIDGSIADFDRAIELDPPLARRHWQRGISYYYAGKYREGMEQFQQYQTYDGSDVENIAWKFLCEAKWKDVETARGNMMKLTSSDRRVPMMAIDAVFRGTARPESVLTAASDATADKRSLRYQKFYAHLYLGLYFEAIGEQPESDRHILAADALANDHYMWNVAHVHAERLRANRKKSDLPSQQ